MVQSTKHRVSVGIGVLEFDGTKEMLMLAAKRGTLGIVWKTFIRVRTRRSLGAPLRDFFPLHSDHSKCSVTR